MSEIFNSLQITFEKKIPYAADIIQQIIKVIGKEKSLQFKTYEGQSLVSIMEQKKVRKYNDFKDNEFSVTNADDSLNISYFYRKSYFIGIYGTWNLFIHVKDFFSDQQYLDLICWSFKKNSFLSAAKEDNYYSLKQLEEQLGTYESCGEEEPNSVRIWNFLDEEWEYDITQNAGYSEAHSHYMEIIAAQMWLGRSFFELTGANREAVLATDWLDITELENGVLELVAWPHPFNSDQGEQRSRQFALRNLLFPDAVAARRTLNIKQRQRVRDLLEEMAEDPEARQSEILRRHIEGFSPDKDPIETALDSDRFKGENGKINLDAAVAYIFRNKPLDVK